MNSRCPPSSAGQGRPRLGPDWPSTGPGWPKDPSRAPCFHAAARPYNDCDLQHICDMLLMSSTNCVTAVYVCCDTTSVQEALTMVCPSLEGAVQLLQDAAHSDIWGPPHVEVYTAAADTLL
jgi:hypothetical protein